MRQNFCLVFASASVLLLVSCGQKTQQDLTQDYVVAKVKSKDPAFRVAGVLELKAFTKNRAKAVSLLKGALEDQNEKVRAAALETLLAFEEEEAGPCLEKIRAMVVGDTDPQVRCLAIDAVAQLARSDDQTVTVLQNGIGDKDLAVAARAAIFLLEHGDQAAGSSAAIAGIISKGLDKAIAERGFEIIGIDLTFGLAELKQKASAAIPELQQASKKAGLSSKVKTLLNATVSAIRTGSGSSGVSKLLQGLHGGLQGEAPSVPGEAPPLDIVIPPPTEVIPPPTEMAPPPTETVTPPPTGTDVPPPTEVEPAPVNVGPPPKAPGVD